MQRLPDWQDRLSAFLDDNAARPYLIGTWDCALFSAGAVEAMTGVDLAAKFRGKYTTAKGAAAALNRYGAGDLPKTLTAALGEPVHPAFAHRGDVALFGSAVGIVMADHALFVGREDGDPETFGLGLVRVPRALIKQAWCVPFEEAE